jgi:hypothetical protein
MKKLILAASALLLSAFSFSGPIQIDIEKDPADREYHHFEVETAQRDSTVKTYILPPGQSKLVIDVNYSKCTYYRAFSVDENGNRSDPTSIKEFRVQKNKVVPCAVIP